MLPTAAVSRMRARLHLARLPLSRPKGIIIGRPHCHLEMENCRTQAIRATIRQYKHGMRRSPFIPIRSRCPTKQFCKGSAQWKTSFPMPHVLRFGPCTFPDFEAISLS